MPHKDKTVDHLGKVQEITNQSIMVKILSHSACSACNAKGGCGMSDTTEKIIVVNKAGHQYFVGQDVKVTLKQAMGYKALLIGYVIPFFVVLSMLIILTAIGTSEAKAGLVSIFILAPYYGLIYYFRDKVSKQFIFDIESI